MSDKFFQLLITRLLPIWVIWQLGWHLAFTHFIRYPEHNISLLVSIKLWTECGFYLAGTLRLITLPGHITRLKIVALAGIMALLVVTLMAI